MMAVVCVARSIEEGRGDGLAKGYHRKKRQLDIRSEEDEDKEGKNKEGRGRGTELFLADKILGWSPPSSRPSAKYVPRWLSETGAVWGGHGGSSQPQALRK
jgi:hypothetical protein